MANFREIPSIKIEVNNGILVSEGEGDSKVEDDSNVNIRGYSRKWSEESTLQLLEECRSRMARFKNPHEKKMDIWREISCAMLSHGYHSASEECDLKWRSLKNQYKMRKGSVKGALWKYYSVMEDILILNESLNGINSHTHDDIITNTTNGPEVNETILCSPDFYGISSIDKGNVEEYIILEGEQDPTERYNRKWSNVSTLQLLEECRLRIEKLLNPKQKKIDVWKEISCALWSRGYHCTAEECDLKWRNLKSQFKNKRGSDKGSLWKYYSIMEGICLWNSSIIESESLIEADASTSTSGHSNGTDNIIYFPDFCINVCNENKNEEVIVSEEDSYQRWSHEATCAFLEECQKDIETIKDPDFSVKRVVWERISKTLSQKGHQFTSRDCNHKWRNLKAQYKKRKGCNLKKGYANSSWRYYSTMERLLDTVDPIIIDVQGSQPPRQNESELECHNPLNSTGQNEFELECHNPLNIGIEFKPQCHNSNHGEPTPKSTVTSSSRSDIDGTELEQHSHNSNDGNPSQESASTSSTCTKSDLGRPIEHKQGPKISIRPYKFGKGYKALRKQHRDLYSPLWAKRLLERIDRNQALVLKEVRQTRQDNLQIQSERNDLLRNILYELQKKS